MTQFPEKETMWFSNLPCFGSRAILAGWYSVVDEALRASDYHKVLKLYEAALCLPLQVRCGPSMKQVALDSISYSEELHAFNTASSDSFITFALKVMSALPAEFFAGTSVKNVTSKLAHLGISFHGSAVGEPLSRALVNVAPFVASADFQNAFRAFEEISPVLNEPTKISYLATACTKAYGKSNGAAVGAAVEVLAALRAGLVYKDITKESHLTKEYLTGGRQKAGFVHWFFKRTAFIDFIKLLVGSSSGPSADEATEKIFPKLTTGLQMEEHFTRPMAEAGSNDGQVRPPCRRPVFCKLSSAVGEHDEDEPESEAMTGVGLGFATMEQFNAFTETLSPSGQLLASLLWKTHGCSFDQDFHTIAQAEISSAQFNFPWAGLFAVKALPSKSSNKDKTEQKVGGLSVPLLRGACAAWIESRLSQPADSDKSAIGDQDRSFSTACKTNDEPTDIKRQQTVTALEELFSTKAMFRSFQSIPLTSNSILRVFKECQSDVSAMLPGASKDRLAKGMPAVGDGNSGVKAKVASTSAVGDGGAIEQDKNGTLYLCCAELFPGHETTFNRDIFRGVISSCSTDFKELMQLALVAALKDDVVIVADGRSDSARKDIRATFTSTVNDDEWFEIWILYDMETSMRQDVRNPKRKLAWGSQNMEVLFVKLPKKAKGQRKLIPRDLFTKCGESTNFSRSYTGVPFRNLAEIPRLTTDSKKSILGDAAVGAFGRDRVDKEVAERGNPLLWGEWKPVTLFSTLIRDFNVAAVVDMSPGSGAACLASLYSNVPYSGIAFNEKHETWLRDLLQKLFVAMVFSNDVAADAELVKNVGTYLSRSAEAAKLMLPKFAAAVGDSLTGVDDSDADE